MKTVVQYKDGLYLSMTETWIYGQIKNLERYRPIVYCHNTENLDIFPIKGIRSLKLNHGAKGISSFLNKSWNKVFGFYPSFWAFLLKDKPDLAHAHYGISGHNFLRLKRMFRIPLITTFYGFDLSQIPSCYPEWKIRYKRLFREGELFLVEGSHMKKTLIELGCTPEKIVIQHLGVDINNIKFEPRRLATDNEIRVLISANFREKKGIPIALEAFARVRQAHPELKLTLTLIGDSRGSPKEEEEKKRILQAIQKFNLKGFINLLGYQPHPVFIKELYNHHIYLQPSIQASDGDNEGGAPVSIIEASASGMPVISTRHCDIPEVVIDKETGYLVREKDIDALAERLDFIVSHPQIWQDLGFKARRHVENNYNHKRQAELLEQIYDEVLKNMAYQ